MLVNVGQNAVKCLHTYEMLSELFSQHNSFICQHTASHWIDMCLVSFYIKISVLQNSSNYTPFLSIFKTIAYYKGIHPFNANVNSMLCIIVKFCNFARKLRNDTYTATTKQTLCGNLVKFPCLSPQCDRPQIEQMGFNSQQGHSYQFSYISFKMTTISPLTNGYTLLFCRLRQMECEATHASLSTSRITVMS